MAPAAEMDTHAGPSKEPSISKENRTTSRSVLADLGTGPNGSVSAPSGDSTTRKAHDSEVQQEWDMVAPSIQKNGLNGGVEVRAQTNGAVTSGNDITLNALATQRSSSHGLGISVVDSHEAVRNDKDKDNARSDDHQRPPSPRQRKQDKEKVLKLSPSQIDELMSSPDSIPVHKIPEALDGDEDAASTPRALLSMDEALAKARNKAEFMRSISGSFYQRRNSKGIHLDDPPTFLITDEDAPMSAPIRQRSHAPRMISSPVSFPRRNSISDEQLLIANLAPRTKQKNAPSHVDLPSLPSQNNLNPTELRDPNPSPMPQSIPLPPLSIPTYLQLELSSSRPSPLYIHRSVNSEFPYESSRVKIERLLNFLLLPPALEQVLWFGALACLDSWLYSFTILPLRFIKALYILLSSWISNIASEVQFISNFVVKGIGRVWRRRLKYTESTSSDPVRSLRMMNGQGHTPNNGDGKIDFNSVSRSDDNRRRKTTILPKHRRQKSVPSALQPDDKADILKGLLMVCTCIILTYFDASRIYHWIRGQNAIKLYVIYNVLEVGDRLLSAIGQDVLECLFSREALERKPDGRSKVVRPFWLFMLALAYTTLHATALFYQVITLNVAVNSYSNALITLLLSNQFVEIKSTVFKKFEKENLFQLTCADVVERFQLWLMLTIIASRNIVETGAFTSWFTVGSGMADHAASSITNSTPLTTSPRSSTSILPQSFTFLPSTAFTSLTGGANSLLTHLAQVLGPFLIVLGSEMIVDWLKHAYINKFNNTRPVIYRRFLDVLAKDYYTNAFANQNLTKRLGLAVIPMACLFFRVSVQTYQMFLQALLPTNASSTEHSAALTAIHEHYSNLPHPSPSQVPFTVNTVVSSSFDWLSRMVNIVVENAVPSPVQSVTFFTIVLVLSGYLILLTLKLTLGILLLSFSRSRYKAMKDREQDEYFNSNDKPSSISSSSGQPQRQQQKPSSQGFVVEGGRRVGGWGVVEVDQDKRRWIYADDPDGLRKLKEREERDKNTVKDAGTLSFESVKRYEMAAKRIW
ncbi:eukaryotic membrane protein family-domain-containing protein [Talaromyces proteolyticus]|uniref:Eukaryotic membrane protein family-domain-containing protein n=1 Tax=Talaromyces proteolyticus TaxID=1131652 RepID=A0AAD4L1T3_9EURO|nr:eukaryotic membrane protein family-domain-containing protein [Talaromyces proteolyticus]KAH8705051.1 eukaryotic membrane protein family-domain-containing protein [Talaromyces proteolyticus]